MTAEAKRPAHTWVDENAQRLSSWTETIWRLAEPAWREYRSAAFYVDLLRSYGFQVEVATGGMPTAFRAVWSQDADGPTSAGYGEYDAAVSFHPGYMPALSNTCVRDTHCGSFQSRVYIFEGMNSAQWGSGQPHVTTPRGEGWWIPEKPASGEVL